MILLQLHIQLNCGSEREKMDSMLEKQWTKRVVKERIFLQFSRVKEIFIDLIFEMEIRIPLNEDKELFLNFE